MATLAGQRAQFTWALRQYNAAEEDDRSKWVKRMAKYLANASSYGATQSQVSQGQSYPATEVEKYLNDPSIFSEPDTTESQAIEAIKESVDQSDVVRSGEGTGTVYAYGYRCAPDRMKIGCTDKDVVARIADQIWISTPDRPCLMLELRTDSCQALERAIHAILKVRGQHVVGGGSEWFTTTREEVLEIYRFVVGGAKNSPPALDFASISSNE